MRKFVIESADRPAGAPLVTLAVTTRDALRIAHQLLHEVVQSDPDSPVEVAFTANIREEP